MPKFKLIAAQSGESVRRVRAQLEKRGLMDVLRNQIIERKTIELVLKHAKFKDVPFKLESLETEAVDEAAGGGEGRGSHSRGQACGRGRAPTRTAGTPVEFRRQTVGRGR